MTDAVAGGARAHPGRLALDDGGRGYSYGELDAAVEGLARRLVGLGVKPGDAVGLLAPTGAGAVAAMYAAPRAGAALAPLGPALTPRELRDALALARPAVVLCDPAHLELARDAAREVDGKAESRVFALGDGVFPPVDRARSSGRLAPADIHQVTPLDGPLPGPGPDDAVAVLRTSGTGGAARAVALTRRNFDASARAVRARLGLCSDDVWYASLSIAHIGGMAPGRPGAGGRQPGRGARRLAAGGAGRAARSRAPSATFRWCRPCWAACSTRTCPAPSPRGCAACWWGERAPRPPWWSARWRPGCRWRSPTG